MWYHKPPNSLYQRAHNVRMRMSKDVILIFLLVVLCIVFRALTKYVHISNIENNCTIPVEKQELDGGCPPGTLCSWPGLESLNAHTEIESLPTLGLLEHLRHKAGSHNVPFRHDHYHHYQNDLRCRNHNPAYPSR